VRTRPFTEAYASSASWSANPAGVIADHTKLCTWAVAEGKSWGRPAGVGQTGGMPPFLTTQVLDAGLDHIRQSPTDNGRLELIVCRPAVDARQLLDAGELDLDTGLIGDNWNVRRSSSTPDGSPDPNGQLTIMNARAIAVVSGVPQPDQWALAGDQLFVDLDLSEAGLPAGTQLSVGEAVIEVTEKPHRGCAKFAARFGVDALRFVNTGPGRILNLRGRNARVVTSGVIRRGDLVQRVNGRH
jgi:hypothetical protein